MHKYLQSLGIKGTLMIHGGCIFLSLILTATGFIEYALVSLLFSASFICYVLYAIQSDQNTFINQLVAVKSGQLEGIDSTDAGLLHRHYPIVDDMVRLANRELNAIESVRDEMMFSTKELSENSLDVAQHCQNQADMTTSSASAATEISLSIEEVSQRIETASQAMDNGSRLCHQGREELMHTKQNVKSLNHQIQATGVSLEELDKKLSAVVAISKFIGEISEQTNLLSLNAAIEAARAGEHGRGFSVVAEEVRGLAQRSHQSASAITNQVTEVTNSMVDVVSQMKLAINATSECQQRVDSAYTSVEETFSVIEQVTEQISGIAVASEQQAIAAKEISMNMEQVASTAEHNAHMARENANIATHLQTMTKREVS
jgi:methyl-accepting chemotaxis protein